MCDSDSTRCSFSMFDRRRSLLCSLSYQVCCHAQLRHCSEHGQCVDEGTACRCDKGYGGEFRHVLAFDHAWCLYWGQRLRIGFFIWYFFFIFVHFFQQCRWRLRGTGGGRPLEQIQRTVGWFGRRQLDARENEKVKRRHRINEENVGFSEQVKRIRGGWAIWSLKQIGQTIGLAASMKARKFRVVTTKKTIF